MGASHWDECANPTCRVFFWNDRGAQKCHDLSCAKHFEHLQRRPERPVLLSLINEFLSQPEVVNDPRLKRVVWRVFGK